MTPSCSSCSHNEVCVWHRWTDEQNGKVVPDFGPINRVVNAMVREQYPPDSVECDMAVDEARRKLGLEVYVPFRLSLGDFMAAHCGCYKAGAEHESETKPTTKPTEQPVSPAVSTPAVETKPDMSAAPTPQWPDWLTPGEALGKHGDWWFWTGEYDNRIDALVCFDDDGCYDGWDAAADYPWTNSEASSYKTAVLSAYAEAHRRGLPGFEKEPVKESP